MAKRELTATQRADNAIKAELALSRAHEFSERLVRALSDAEDALKVEGLSVEHRKSIRQLRKLAKKIEGETRVHHAAWRVIRAIRKTRAKL